MLWVDSELFKIDADEIRMMESSHYLEYLGLLLDRAQNSILSTEKTSGSRLRFKRISPGVALPSIFV